MYKIGELSRLSHIPVKTLRYYDNEGLLVPDEIDKYTGYRYYSASKLSDCYRILAMKELGFTLEEIKAQNSLSREELSCLLAAKERELNGVMNETARHIKILRQISSALKEDNSMFNIIVKKDDSILLAYRRLIIKDKSEIPKIIREIRDSLPGKKTGLRTVLIDYETDYLTDGCDMGFGVELTGNIPLSDADDITGKLITKTISFTDDTASLICRPEEIEEAKTALYRYVHDNHYQVTGASCQIIYGDGTVELKLPVWKLLSQETPPRNDDLNLPFENDPRVIGRWQFLDALPSREQFHPRKPKTILEHYTAKDLYFLPGGEKYWIYGWTKGYLLCSCNYPRQEGANPYWLETVCGETYLFVEMKGRLYFNFGGKPEIRVYKKVDSREYTRREIMIRDEIPNLPAIDPEVLGTWDVCAYVSSPEDFNPDLPDSGSCLPYEALFWRKAEFLKDGVLKNSFLNQDGSIYTDSPDIWHWVKGNVICIPRSTVSVYFIREYKGTRYLFVQWKSGDYSFGGTVKGWYVFRFCAE